MQINKKHKVHLNEFLDGQKIDKLEDIIADAVRVFDATSVVIRDDIGNTVIIDPEAFKGGDCDD